jgi:hypothetical protein
MTNLETHHIKDFQVDGASGAVKIVFDAGGEEYAVDFKSTAVTKLIAALFACPLNREGQPVNAHITPMAPRMMGLFRIPSAGVSGISLLIADRVMVPVALTAAQRAELRKHLAKLDASTSGTEP